MADLNLNTAECIVSTTNLGSHVYHNICNGSQTIVYWGHGDWLGAGVLAAVLLVGLYVLFLPIFSMLRG